MGEVVFNTSLTGYQEILTDPSYKGQFVVFTYPHIGNVGINPEDMESSRVHMGGVIVRDLSATVSNYRANQTLDAYLKDQKVLGIAGVDTRAITRRLRVTGCLNGAICTDPSVSGEPCWLAVGAGRRYAVHAGALRSAWSPISHGWEPSLASHRASLPAVLPLTVLPHRRRRAAGQVQVVDDCGQGLDQGGDLLGALPLGGADRRGVGVCARGPRPRRRQAAEGGGIR